MECIINGIDWINCDAMRYWSYPNSYKKDFKAEIKNYIFSGDYCGALKRDGYYQRCCINSKGEAFLISRNKSVSGEAINKIDWVPHLKPYFDSLPKNTVLLCEIYLPGNEGSKKITSLLGCLKDKCIARQEAAQKLHLYVFDVMVSDGEDFVKKGMWDRADELNVLARAYPNPYVEYAEYYDGKELWEKLNEYLAAGNEGMVIHHKDCPVYFKRTPARQTIKVKKEIANTIDCFFTGRATPPKKEYTGKEIETWPYWMNVVAEMKLPIDPMANYYKDYVEGDPIMPVTKSYYNNFAGSLEIAVLKEGKIFPIVILSGLTEEIKKNPESYKGRCIEVNAMEIDTDNGVSLRHAKFVQFRDDLTIKDCTYEKVFGD